MHISSYFVSVLYTVPYCFIFIIIGATTLCCAGFGQGTGPITLDDLRCNGNELSLFDCLHHSIRSCSHREDVGIICQGVLAECVICDKFWGISHIMYKQSKMLSSRYDCTHFPSLNCYGKRKEAN